MLKWKKCLPYPPYIFEYTACSYDQLFNAKNSWVWRETTSGSKSYEWKHMRSDEAFLIAVAHRSPLIRVGSPC